MSGIEMFAMAAAAAGAMNTIAQGQYADKQGKAAFKQLREQANRSEALSQREAIERRREANLISSRALAIAGASGAGVDDPTVENILHDIGTQGEYNVLSALYDGKLQARSERYQAETAREEGRMAKKASYLQAIGNLGKSMYDVSGGGMFTNEGVFGMKGTATSTRIG